MLQERRRHYSPWRKPVSAQDSVVIVLDDGLATGATMVATLTAVRHHRPQRLVCTVPVASGEALRLVETLSDETVCLSVPALFQAVGQFHKDFPQVSDDVVARCLQQQGFSPPC